MKIVKLFLLAAVLAAVAGAAALWLSGYRAYIIHTGSMTPSLVPGDLVIDTPAGHALRPGQVITFRHSNLTTDVVTHRFVSESGGTIVTKGDANTTVDPWRIRPDQVQGRLALQVPYAGFAVVYFEQPAGVASLVAGAIGLILLWQLFFPSRSEAPQPVVALAA